MRKYAQQYIAIACLFTWIGFVGAISFLESWLKFKAPGITVPLGLGIGQLMFSALNKVEWFFTIVICISIVLRGKPYLTGPYKFFILVIAILIVQTIWLLPAMDARAEMYIQENQEATPSDLHIWFAGLEFIKVLGLAITGFLVLNSRHRESRKHKRHSSSSGARHS